MQGGIMGITTTLRIMDQMTAPIMSINNAINNLTTGLKGVENAADIDAGSFEMMKHQVNTASFAAEQLNQSYQLVGDSVSEAASRQNELNNNVRQGSAAVNELNNNIRQGGISADSLVSRLKSVAAVYASIRGVKMVLGLSDELAQTSARLDLINDKTQTTAELQQKIFQSAQRSRGAYMETAGAVSKLGLLAGKAFSSNDEIIAFTEQMNKNFVIGGASIQEQTSAMHQLTQAMASGRLQGDEYRSIIENAPLLAGAIEDYMTNAGVSGTMKDWASQGLLTADVIKMHCFRLQTRQMSGLKRCRKLLGKP